MKKFVIMVMAMFMTIAAATAQTVEGSRTFDNMYVGVEGGVLTPLTSINLNSVRPAVGLEIGKDFTPVVGISVEALGLINTTKANTIFDQSNVVLNGKLNLSNWLAGYNGQPRRIEFLVVPGIGWGHNYGYADSETMESVIVPNGDRNYLTYNAYGQINFNLGKARAWQLFVKSGVTWNTGAPNVAFDANRGAWNTRVGFTYKFGHKNTKGVKTHNFTVVPVPYFSQKEVDDAVIAALQKAEPKVVEKEVIKETVVERVVEKVVEVKPTLNPTFVKNMAIVDETSLSYLDMLASEMNSTDKNYTLTGYASLEGTEAYNEKLSLKRAEAIKQCLVDRGVAANRLTTVAGGATDKFGSRYEQNRIVVVE